LLLLKQNGEPPGLRLLARELGLSTTSVNNTLKILNRDGYVKLPKQVPYTLTPEALRWLGEEE
jgi:Mn-dependent DtxR family transcriptional regulator